MKSVRRAGRIVVTNHDEPGAVMLSADEYAAIARAAATRPDWMRCARKASTPYSCSATRPATPASASARATRCAHP